MAAQITQTLHDSLDLLEVCNQLPDDPPPARSLPTARRRLGLDVDSHIQKIPTCDKCYKVYTQATIDRMQNPTCKEKNCRGNVWRLKRCAPREGNPLDLTDDGQTYKRSPIKYLSYSPLIPALRRFLMRPDFVANLRDPALDGIDIATDRTPSTRMNDIYDGTAWKMQEIGLRRVVRPDGSVRDIEDRPGSRKKLCECEVGLNMFINIDW